MTCSDVRPHLALAGKEALAPDVLTHLEACPACAREHQALLDTWDALGLLAVERASPALRRRVVRGLGSSWYLPSAAAVLLLVGGFGAGWLLRPAQALDPEIVQRQGILRLLRHGSVGERATGLALVGGEDEVPELLDALLERLLRDPDPRIRREAAEALTLFAGRPSLRDRIVAQLARERDPEVQLALVDLLGAFREQAARAALRRLVDEGRLQGRARDHAHQALAL